MISIAIVDSGPLIAVANSSDPDHRACLDALQTPGIHLMIPAFCVAEAAYLIGRRQGSHVEAQFLRGLQEFDVQSPTNDEWSRIAQLVDEYGDFPLGAADASVVALADRMKSDLIITLDQPHFRAVRNSRNRQFRLLPFDG